jgi:hypothetical protein
MIASIMGGDDDEDDDNGDDDDRHGESCIDETTVSMEGPHSRQLFGTMSDANVTAAPSIEATLKTAPLPANKSITMAPGRTRAAVAVR